MKLKLQSSTTSLLFSFFFLVNLNNVRAQLRDTTLYDYQANVSSCQICASGYTCFTSSQQLLIDNNSSGRLSEIKIRIHHTSCGTGNFYVMMNGDTLGVITPAYTCQCNTCTIDTIVASFSLLGSYIYNDTNFISFQGIQLCVDRIEVIRSFVGTANNDAAVLTVDSPSRACPGTRNIVVTIGNMGVNILDSVKVHWTYNGITQSTYRFNSILDTIGGSGTYKAKVVLGSKTLIAGKRDTLKVWTSMPNGVTDPANNNDTLLTFIKPSIGDTITVGGTNPDYSSIQAAINDLQTNGICGPVVVDIRPGSYNEQLIIGKIFGADSNNTITFRPSTDDSNDVSIYYSSFSSTFNYTVLLKDARHIIFSKLAIEAVGTSNATAISIQGSFLNLSFMSCLITGYSSSSTGSNQALVFGTGITGTGNRKILFDRCGFEFGSVGFYWTVSNNVSNLTISNCNFNEQYYTNIFAYYFSNVLLHNNTILRSASSYSNGYGIYCSNNTNITVTKNRILQLNGANAGLYTSNANRTGSFRNLIANNFISVGKAASVPAYAYQSSSSNYIDFYNNSTFSMSTSTGYSNLYFNGGSNISIRNNSIVQDGPSSYLIYNSGTNNIIKSDNNNFYSAAPGFYKNAALSGLSAWQNATLFDSASTFGSPNYKSTSDLHAYSSDLNGNAIPDSRISKDMDGETRNSVKPDVGADEFDLVPVDAGISTIFPYKADSVCVQVVLKNHGNDTLKNAQIGWSINGSSKTAYSWSGSLPSGDTAILCLGKHKFAKNTTYTIKTWSYSPNGVPDTLNFNDTSIRIGKPALSGVYTIGGTSPDFSTFTAAVADMTAGGIIDSVLFQVRNGNYNERIVIGAIQGATRKNAIVFESQNKDSSLVTLSYATTNTSAFYEVVWLNGANWVNFRFMTIKSTTSTSPNRAVTISNGASNIEFYHNRIESPVATGSDLTYNILVFDDNIGSKINFIGNHFKNGSSAMYINGNTENIISGNFFENAYYLGTYINSVTKMIFTGNTTKSNSAYSSHYSTYFSQLSGSNIISGNRISGPNKSEIYGLYIGNIAFSSSTDSTFIFNNFIDLGGNNAQYAVYINSAYKTYIAYNNINYYGTRSGSISSRLSSLNNCNIYNNNFINSDFGMALQLLTPSNTINDFNNYFTKGSSLAQLSSTTYANLAAMKANGNNLNSISVNPDFISNTDLHVQNIILNGKAKVLHFVKQDIDRENRDAVKPDIGADEFIPLTLDAGVLAFISPGQSLKPDSVIIKVAVINRGLDTLFSVKVHCIVNVDTFASITINDTLASGDTSHVILGVYKFLRDSINNLTAWTSLPNNSSDQKTSNDTLRIKNKKTAMSGVYTIGGSSPDFVSFKSAIKAMKEAGISDSVRFRVRSGTYTEQLNITRIEGALIRDAVVFESENLDSTSVTLRYSSTFSDTNYVVFFNGASFITFRHLTITPLNTTYGVAFLYENGASYNTLKNNQVKSSSFNSTGTNLALIASNNSASSEGFNEFHNNLFEGGSYGMYWYGYGPPNYQEDGLKITNNYFKNQFYTGMYLYYQRAALVDRNLFSSTSTYTDYFGIRGAEIYGKTKITSNIIKRKDYGRYGIYINGGNGNSDTLLIANNMIHIGGTSNSYGIYLSSVTKCHTINNTVRLNSTTNVNGAGIYISSGGTQQLLNNIIENAGTGYAYDVSSSSIISKSDKNNLRTAGTYLARWNGNTYTTLAALISASGKDVNSLSLNPLFLATDNLHVKQIGLNAKADKYPGITTDIDGELRDSLIPDIGADEFEPPPLDAGIFDIIVPKTPFLPDSQFVKVVFKNFGLNTISSVTIDWEFNSIAQTTLNWTGSLASNDTVHIILGKRFFKPDSAYSLKAWTSLPNSYNDPDNSNDTSKALQQYPALSGTYTIGGASPNYTTFTDAINAMKRGGIIGNVIFNVRNGSYSEQLVIPAIIGANDRNDIIFQSENLDSTKVVLTNSANSTNNYTVKLDGANFVTFRHLTISATHTTYGVVFELVNGASYNSLSNNIIEGITTTSSGTNLALINSNVTNGKNNNFNHFTRNLFLNGSYGIYDYGYNNGIYNKNLLIKDNKFETPYYYGLMIYYNDTSTIVGNKINMSNYQYSIGIYLYVNNGAFNVSSNYIHIPNGYMGINLQSCSGFSAKRAMLSNNMITLLGAYDAYGIYSTSCNYINFFHNNVRLASTYASSYAMYHSSNGNIQSLNNIFEHTGNGYAFYTSSTSSVTNSDYNCYRTNGNYLAYWGGDRSNLAALRAANSKDAKSMSVDPFFISGTDLHIRSIDLSQAGYPLLVVPLDFDGNKRDSLTPDIGADEFEIPSPDDAGISAFAGPHAPFASGTRPVKLILYNHGSDSLKSATIQWTMNGVSQTAYSWTGGIKSGDSDTADVGNFNFSSGVNYTLRAWPVSPNGKPDTLNYNDTLTKLNLFSALKGTYTIGGSLPDFSTFADARNALMLGGILDTVKFKVRNGTYTEQVQLLPYPGSATNKPVTFTSESGDSTKVILQFSSGSSNDYVFSLKGADNITISHMTLRSTDYYYGNVVVIDNGAIGTTIKNNRLIVANTYYYYGVGVLSSADRDDNTRILNNYINGGNYGIQLYGGGTSTNLQETGLLIEGNTIENVYSSGLYLSYMNAPSIKRNQISLRSGGGNYLIYVRDVYNDMIISHNKLIGNYAYNYGIYINNHQGISTKKGLIYNNFISLPDPYYYGIYLNSTNYTNIYYNSINLYGTASQTNSSCLYLQSASNVDLRNNILSNKAGTYTIYCNNVPTTSNYNDLFSSGTNLGFVGSTNYTSLSSWKSGTSKDANSVSVNPNFISNTDLHTSLINLDSAATPLSGITDDIDKNTRNTTRPDIGADEFNSLPNNLAITKIINPVNGCEIDSQVLKVTIFNFGSNSQKNFSVRYTVNGGSIVSQTFTDSVYPGFSKTFEFTGKVNTAANGNYNFVVWTDLNTEQFRLNDTLKVQVINYQTPDSVGIMIPSDSAENLDFPFSLSWAPSTGATLYDLYIWPDTVSQRPSTAAFAGLTQISKQITGGLGYGVMYQWQVIARNPSCSTPGPLQRFSIRKLPDVVVTSISVPSSSFSGNTISVSWVVKNTGTGSTLSAYWYDVLYLSTDKILDGTDIVLTGVTNLTSLIPSKTYNQSANVTLPNGISGKYYILVKTDAYGYLLESNEGNNIRSDSAGMTVSLTPPPDLRVTSITKPSTAFSGQTINVRFVVKNFGSGGTRTGSWIDYVYLHNDSVAGGTLMKNIQRSKALDPDSSYVVNTSFALPLTISGGYYIIVKTDANNNVYEHASENNNERVSDSMKVILTPPPDLIVRNVMLKDTASNRESINLTYDLINQGGSATNSAWYDFAYISKFNTFNVNNSTHIGAFYRSNIGSDDTQTVSQNVLMPDNINGKYYIYIVSDVYNAQFEGSNDTNNLSVARAIRIESPDLIIPSVIIPAADTSGMLIPVEWIIKNVGEGKLIGINREDKIYISRHNVFHKDSVTLIDSLTYNTAINSGDSAFKSHNSRIPNGIYGTRYVFVRTDASNNVFENNRDNNNTKRSSSINVTLAPYPDLRTILVTTPDSSEAGATISISYEVENKGNCDATPVWKDKVYISKDSLYNTSKFILLQTNSISDILMMDSSYTYTQNLQMPSNLSAGNYFFYVFTESNNVLYEYLFENNNIKRSKKVFVKGYPPVDLTVISTSIPDTVYSGTNASFSWQVKNIGQAITVANTWTDRVYLSSDSIFDASDKVIGSEDVFTPLAVNSTYTRNISFSVPNGLGGNYYVFFKTDYKDDNNDEDTLNNLKIARLSNGTAKTMRIMLSLSSDLQITDWDIPSTATTGQPYTFKWKVDNKGDTTTKAGSWNDRVYLSTDYAIDNSDIILGSNPRTKDLIKNGFYTVTTDFYIPNVSGNFIVLLKTDEANTEYEHNAEHNNTQASVITISVAPPGDLIVNSVSAPDSVKAGSLIEVDYQIKNKGSNPISGSRTDNVYISKDKTLDENDILIASNVTSASLVPNATSNLSVSGRVTGIAMGQYYIIVFVDVKDNINESNDTNNTGHSDIIEISIPELPLNVQTPDTLYNSEQMYYRLVIHDSLAGESILITLKGDSLNGQNEIYLRFNDVPSRSEFDFNFSTPFYGNQEILVPEVLSGTYYLMAYGSTTAGPRQDIQLFARKLDFEIRRINPVSGGNTGQVTAKIEGSKFDLNTVFYLELDSAYSGPTPFGYFIPSSIDDSVFLVDPTLAYVTFKLDAQLMGRYHVRGIKSTDTATLFKGFSVEAGAPADLQINVIRPDNTRANAIITIEVFFTNSGNTDIINSELEIISTAGAPIAFTLEDLVDKETTLMVPVQETGAPPGRLRPKASGSIIIYAFANAALGFNIILPVLK